MEFGVFSKKLVRRMGASLNTIYRLDHEGRMAAEVAHRDIWKAGGLDGVESENDFHSFCAHTGREFVLENLEIFC